MSNNAIEKINRVYTRVFNSDDMMKIPNVNYIKACHYFSSCSMGNFWNTFPKGQVESDLNIIKEHGFNTVILILPWSNFQPTYDPVTYDLTMIERLDFLINAIKSKKLKLILRVGYLWSNSNERVTTFKRYRLLYGSKKLQLAWCDYIKKIETLLKASQIKYSFFLCWEDFYWTVLRININTPIKERVELAESIGYHDYLSIQYTTEEYNDIYQVDVKSFRELPIPIINDVEYKELHFYFDNFFINKIITLTKASLEFNKIIYEHRVDPDMHHLHGSIDFNYNKKNIDLDAIYYHPKIGDDSNEPFSLVEAYSHFEKVLNNFRSNSIYRKAPFIDQLNFHSTNPDYPLFSRINSELHAEFLKKISTILMNKTSGYGVWGFFDWINDKIYNGVYELGLKGWDYEKVKIISLKPELSEGSSLIQHISEVIDNAIVELTLLTYTDDFNITLNGQVLTKLNLNNNLIKFNLGKVSSISLIVNKGVVRIDKISLYNRVYSNGFLTRDRVERLTSKVIKEININLN